MVINKVCHCCKLQLSAVDFGINKSRPDGLQGTCKACKKQYNKKHYIQNKKLYKTRAKESRKIYIDWFQSLKSSKQCEKCGEKHIACLQFHHRKPETKKFSIAEGIKNGYTKSTILKEIEQCDVLCANCHTKLHWDNNHEAIV